jgi:hypothetical protein
MEHFEWILGPAILTIVRAVAYAAQEHARRKTKISLLQHTRPGSCTIDQDGKNVFFAGPPPATETVDHVPEPGGD